MKDKEQKRGRLYILFARGYIGFTLALLLITGSTFYISELYFDALLRVPDVDRLIEFAETGEDYDKIPAEKLLGTNGAFAILDQEGRAVYRSSDQISDYFTPGELEAIQNYEEDSYIEHVSFSSKEGSPQHLLIKYYFGEDDTLSEKVMILDEEYQVKAGGFQDEKKSYTEREFEYMTGTLSSGLEIIQYHMKGHDGPETTLVMIYESLSVDSYQNMVKKSDRVYFILIPLYFIAITGFILWLNKKVKDPLVQLNRAIDHFSLGETGQAGNLEGPWEIRKIGTNFDKMAELLAESEKERKRLDSQRQKLIADISHDLKTPITVISGYTKAIRDGKVPAEKISDYLERIDIKVEELNELINSFHEFSKVEHPNFLLNLQIVDICEFLRGYLADRYDEIQLAGFYLQADIPEEPIYVNLDGPQFRRALDNILYNSVKYNSLGTVLAVGIEKNEKNSKSVGIYIADNGIGVSPDQRETIFQPFVMGDESRSGGGSGLGLAISKRIVESHGGSIGLQPVTDGGFSTVFKIILQTEAEKKEEIIKDL